MADGVGKLDFRARGDACRDNILRDVTAHVSRAAIHLAWVFAGERAAAVTAHAAVAVHDDLAAGQTGVALRSANDEAAGGVDEKLRFLSEQMLRQNLLDDLLDAKFLDRLVLHVGAVLR